jgi:tight adherence protein C
VLLISALAGVAVLLFGLPACLEKTAADEGDLFGRIERERQARLAESFRRRRSSWTIVRALERRERWLESLCRWTGVDRKKTADMLYRLRSPITVTEVALAKAVGGAVMLGAALQMAARLYSGREWSVLAAWPMLGAVLTFLLPTLLLGWADKRAKAEMAEQVPVFFSIVQALVEAGMPIQAAVKQAARRFDGRLGRELARLEVEEKRCGSWRKALEELAFRWEVDTLTAIALEINEAISKGVSVAPMLAVQVEEQVRQQEDEASAHMNRLNVRLLPFVIVLMGVPLLYLVMGPAFMGIGARL